MLTLGSNNPVLRVFSLLALLNWQNLTMDVIPDATLCIYPGLGPTQYVPLWAALQKIKENKSE